MHIHDGDLFLYIIVVGMLILHVFWLMSMCVVYMAQKMAPELLPEKYTQVKWLEVAEACVGIVLFSAVLYKFFIK